jgi:ABC-type transport system involved in multi-copper enzyme maturation permease subunit
MKSLITIARLECVSTARLKWVRLLAMAFALLAVAAAYSAGAANDLSGADGFARTTMTLVPVAILLIPLGALVLGVSGQAADAGSDPFLFAQPIDRGTVLIGRWFGELVALGGAIVFGFGAGAVVVASSAGPAGIWSFAGFVSACVMLAAVFLSIAAAIAAATDKRVTALGIATFAWFFFVLLYDAIVLSTAGWLAGRLGGGVLFVSVFGNPADVIRIAMLLIAGTANVLGAAGEAWTRFLGGEGRAVAATAVALLAWMTVPLGIAVTTLRVRDL